MKKRNSNIEMLRGLSCLTVVLLHLNEWSFDRDELGGGYSLYVAIHIFTRFAVPCFMLITGTYIFEKAAKLSLKKYYQYAAKKIIVPTLLWSTVYCAFLYVKGMLSVIALNESFDFWEPISLWIHGKPFGHLWYMYMLFGLYLFMPLLIWIRSKISLISWIVVGTICLVVSAVVHDVNLLGPIWLICWMQYIGYFIAGDVVGRTWERRSKRAVFGSFVVAIVVGSVMFWKCLYSYKDFQPQSLLTFVMSFAIYFGFYNLHMEIDCPPVKTLANNSADIYYLHGGIIVVLDIFLKIWPVHYTNQIIFYLIGLPLTILFCLVICRLLSALRGVTEYKN